LKNSHADHRQGIDCHEKGQRPFQPIHPFTKDLTLKLAWLGCLAKLHFTKFNPTCVTCIAQSIGFGRGYIAALTLMNNGQLLCEFGS